jgi:hypothetical protein
MNRSTAPFVIMAALCLLGAAGDGSAQSIFGINYLGEHLYNGSNRYRSLGLASFAMPDSNHAAASNIAALADIGGITVSITQYVSTGKVNTKDVAADRNRYQLPEVGVAVPVRSGLVIATGYRVRFAGHGDFEYELPHEDMPTTYEEHGMRGTLFTVPLVVAWKPAPWLRVGGEFQVERGSILNEVSITYRQAGYESADSKRERLFSGTSWAASVLLRPHRRIFIAGGYDADVSYRVDEQLRYGRDDLDSDSGYDFKLPHAYRAAISLGLTDRWHVMSQFAVREAPEPTGYPQFAGSLNEERLIAAGMERIAAAEGGFFSRMPLRFGFYERKWHIEIPAGRPVIGRFFTFGSGFNMPGGPGTIDLSFEVGKVGSVADNGIDETMFRFGLGLSFTEAWQQRREKKH